MPTIKLVPVKGMPSCTADILTNVTTANSTALLEKVLSKFQPEELRCMHPRFLIKF